MNLTVPEILTIEIFKKFIKHYAPRRFNYTYATNVLKFRERHNKYGKRANIICIKKGHTKSKYLDPVINKDGIKWSIPNYTRAKEWKLPPRRFKAIFNSILKEQNYWKIVSHLRKMMPGIDFNIIKRTASWFMKERKKPRPVFRTDVSVYDELSRILDSEIQACANKLKNLTIKEAKI